MGAEGVHDPVVEVEERQTRLRDREVLVVSGIGDQRRPLRGFRRTGPNSRQIEPVAVDVPAGRVRGVRVGRIRDTGDASEADGGSGTGLELDSVGGVEAPVLGVGRAASIYGVQIQRRGAAVDQLVHGDVLPQRHRGGVHGEVVVDELLEIGEPGGDRICAACGGVGLVVWSGHRPGEFLVQRGISQLPHGAQPREPEHLASARATGHVRVGP